LVIQMVLTHSIDVSEIVETDSDAFLDIMDLENVKLKYITLKEKLAVKLQDAEEIELEFNEVNRKAQEAERRSAELKERLEQLLDEKTKVESKDKELQESVSEGTYNKEDLRHKQTSGEAKKAYVGDRRAFLKGHLENIHEETRLQNEEIQELTNETNEIEEELFVEEERLKVVYKKNKELNEILADLKEKGRQLESREEQMYDREDELMVQIYQKEVLVKHQEQIADQYEGMEIELENTLAQLQDEREIAIEGYNSTKKRFEELLDEIIEF